MIEIFLFGKPHILIDGQPAGRLPTAKTAALLAYLVLERQRAHTRDQLIDLLWPDFSPRKARQNLSQTLARLRRALGSAADIIVSTHSTIEVSASAELRVDVFEFLKLIADTNQHAHLNVQRCDACHARLARAVALVKGELLIGVEVNDGADFEQWLLVERERLHDAHLEALFDLAAGALERQDYRAVITYARQQIALEGWRERAYRQLISALALDGQQVAALAEYERLHTTLLAELGVEPSSTMHALVEQIQRGEFSVPTAPALLPNNLPAPLTTFVGRKEILGEIVSAIIDGSSRLNTIVGPGGVGKTWLATEVGRQLITQPHGRIDGIWFVPLTGVTAVENIPLAIAGALNLDLPVAADIKSAVIKQLRGQRLLLILDNFEQLLDGRSWLIELLQAAPAVHLLVTSREQLNLRAEDIFHLVGLSVPLQGTPLEQAHDYEAVMLFLNGARRLDKRWRLDASKWPHIIEICRLLEGLPLGIELAVALLEDYEPAAVVEQISVRWPSDSDVLSTSYEDIAPHHRSLYSVFAQSWHRLTDQQQIALARLSVFRGDFDLTAALRVAGSTSGVIKRLQYKSLLRSAGVGRFNMHQLIRQFAAQQLAQHPQQTAIARELHATHYLGQAAAYYHALGDEQRRLLTVLRQDLFNIEAGWLYAVQTRNIPLLQQAIKGLGRYLWSMSLNRVGRGLFHAVCDLFVDRSIDQLSDAERTLYGWAVVEEAGTWADLQLYDKSNAILDGASNILNVVNDLSLHATLNYHRGRAMLHQKGDNARALEILERGIAYARQGSDRGIEISLLRHTSNVYGQRGDYQTTLDYLEQALAISRAVGDQINEQMMVYFIGSYLATAGHYWRAREMLMLSQTLDAVTGSPYQRWASEAGLGAIDARLGKVEQGIQRQQRAISELRTLDDNWRVTAGLIDLAISQMLFGRYEAATISLQAAHQITQRVGLVELAATVQLASSYVAFYQNQFNAAVEMFAAAQQKMTAIGRQIGIVEARILRAYCAHKVGVASERVTDSLDYLRTQRLEGAQQPELLCWVAYQVATVYELPNAEVWLEIGRNFVRNMANTVDDPDYRHAYLHNRPVFSLPGLDSAPNSNALASEC